MLGVKKNLNRSPPARRLKKVHYFGCAMIKDGLGMECATCLLAFVANLFAICFY